MGTVVFSVDAELGWGFHDVDHPVDRMEAARPGWHRLVELFDEYEVPATWALVGHLLLSDCDTYHDDHPAGRDWFASERGKWADRPDLRYGLDLFDRLEGAAVDHDIGNHTFSHVIFGNEATSREIARAELERSVTIGERRGFDSRSFVFPRNSIGHRDLLAEYGFTTYRGTNPYKRSALGKLVSATVGDSGPWLVTPRVDEHGLVNIPASLYLFGFEGRTKRTIATLLEDPIVRQARRGIDVASRSDGVFHMWLHPNNLVSGADVRRVESILSYLDARRADVEIATMADVAARTTASAPGANAPSSSLTREQ